MSEPNAAGQGSLKFFLYQRLRVSSAWNSYVAQRLSREWVWGRPMQRESLYTSRRSDDDHFPHLCDETDHVPGTGTRQLSPFCSRFFFQRQHKRKEKKQKKGSSSCCRPSLLWFLHLLRRGPSFVLPMHFNDWRYLRYCFPPPLLPPHPFFGLSCSGRVSPALAILFLK